MFILNDVPFARVAGRKFENVPGVESTFRGSFVLIDLVQNNRLLDQAVFPADIFVRRLTKFQVPVWAAQVRPMQASPRRSSPDPPEAAFYETASSTKEI